MKIFLADRPSGEDVYCVQFDAWNWEDAQQIADQNHWELLGELITERDCPEEVIAMIETQTAVRH